MPVKNKSFNRKKLSVNSRYAPRVPRDASGEAQILSNPAFVARGK
jgi:hypothetical protein